jgi:hypothetical protein
MAVRSTCIMWWLGPDGDDQRGRAGGRGWALAAQIQETPRILIPFPEMVRPTRRWTGRVPGALRGAMGACGPERTPVICRAP